MPNKIKPRRISTWDRIRNWVKGLLDTSKDHYLCFLPSPTGLFSAFFLERFYSGIHMGEDQAEIVKNIPENAIIVYTTKYKGRFEFLFFHTRYRQMRLPVPQLAFDFKLYGWQPLTRLIRVVIANVDALVKRHRTQNPYENDYYKRELLHTGCAALGLIEKKGFYLRFVKARTDPLAYLIEMQQRIDRPIYLVPQLMFFGKKPQPSIPSLVDMIFGTPQQPGSLRKIVTLFRHPEKIFVELSEPLHLGRWLRQPTIAEKTLDRQALALRRQLLSQLNRHRQSITGPILKSNEELKESILTSDRLRTFIKKHADSRGEPIVKIRKEADGYIDEIAARYSPSTIRIMSYVVGWIVNSMFDGVVMEKQGLAKIKAMSMNGPLILVPCHKSHIDYLILSYVLYHNNMPCPLVAAGKNLSFWPLGLIFRSGGAFFLRRTFRGAVLYSRVFAAYIHKLLEEGFNIEMFIEGGRSRTGKLLMPKLGLLSILLDSYRNGACANMSFVPVYIGYDRIVEEQAYVNEVEGGSKEDENLSQMIRAHRFLKKRYGKIYINFADPITISDLLADTSQSLDQMPQKEVNALCRNLGWRIINAIDKQTVVTPHGLVAAAILNFPRPRFTKGELIAVVNTYLSFAAAQNANLADTIIVNADGAIDAVLERYLSRKWIEKAPGDKDLSEDQTAYTANTSKRSLLEFYKNNCISYFIPAAFTSLAILKTDAFQFNAPDLQTTYQTLMDFFKYEFAFDLDRSSLYYQRKTIKSFIDDAILMPHPTIPDCYQITSSGYRKLKLFAAFVKPYFQSYKVGLHFLRANRKEKMETKDKLKKIQSMGLQMLKAKEIDLIESISKINFANALTYFGTNGIKNHENEEAILRYESFIHSYLDLLGT